MAISERTIKIDLDSEPYPVPGNSRFEKHDESLPPEEGDIEPEPVYVDFIRADDLWHLACQLIGQYDLKFRHLTGMRIAYLWKREGGKASGRATLGRCQHPAGLLAHYSESDFVIWLAADHLRAMRASRKQVRALLFHELLHAGINDKGNTVIYPHDFEGFAAEIEEFGIYKADIRLVQRAMERQLPLFAPSRTQLAVEAAEAIERHHQAKPVQMTCVCGHSVSSHEDEGKSFACDECTCPTYRPDPHQEGIV